jgi:hypothetical protein
MSKKSHNETFSTALVKSEPRKIDETYGKEIYVPMLIHKWETLKDTDGEPIGVKAAAIGFLPVFHDKSLAEKTYPNATIYTYKIEGDFEL